MVKRRWREVNVLEICTKVELIRHVDWLDGDREDLR